MSRNALGHLTALMFLISCLSSGGCSQDTPAADAARERASVDPSEAEMIEQLSAIGYVAGSLPAPATTGVTHYERELVEPRLHLITSAHGPVATLMDLEGKILHEWTAEFAALFPEHPEAKKGLGEHRNFWRDAELLPNGDLIGVWELFGIFKLDRDSNVVWVRAENAHHDIYVADDSKIYSLGAERELFREIPEKRALADYIVVHNAAGEELSRLSIADALEGADWPALREAFWQRERIRRSGLKERARYDPFHTNSLHLLTSQEAMRLGDPFRPGDALVSMAMLDTIAVIDLATGSARWWQQGPFALQHQPRVTLDGKIILFNNYLDKQRSSIARLDPATREVVWEYWGTDSDPLYSKRSGGVEVLPNGNILIVETDQGRILEITPEKEIVWEYRNPHTTGQNGDLVAHIYSLDVVDESAVGWLKQQD